jgi:long-chain acyl-CoA synthetase
MFTDLGRMLEGSVQQYGDRPAIIHEGKQYNYKELNGAVTVLAKSLRSLGIGKGDHVALMLPNCPEFVASYFAAQKIGAVAVTINAQSTSYELRYLLDNCDARCFITSAPLARRFEEIRAELRQCRHLIIVAGEGGDSPFERATEGSAFPFDIPKLDLDDPAVMIYTSGLTGRPLGAVLTQRNMLHQSTLLRLMINGTEKDRNLSIIPFFHSFGASVNMVGTLRIGMSMVIMERFTLEGIFQAIERDKVTFIAAVPRLFLGMLLQEGAESYDVSSLRLCVTGGAAMPPELILPFEKKFGVTILEGYGLTEASPVCSFSRLDMPKKPGSIGMALPDVSARIMDDHRRELPRGREGELVIKGDNVMRGYYKDAEATADVIRDGWLHTGDLARIDEEGYIFLTGRKKRMIITSGFNVYPKEVETVLLLHPAVAAAEVISKPDLLRGEIVKARIVTRPGLSTDEKDLLKHCRVYLSSYKQPREIEFVEKI